MLDRVSPAQGQEPLAAGVPASVHSPTSSILYSQFRGPFALNLAETEEEKKAREDEEKKSNFKKVQEKAEREETARKKAEQERDALLKEKAEREAQEKKAAEAKLAEEKKFEELAQQKDAEAKAKGDEAAKEKARADALEQKVKAFEDQQEAELQEILKKIPDDKKPPLDASDPVSKRLQQAKYAFQLLNLKPDDPVGAGTRHKPDQSKKDRYQELLKKPFRTPEESGELAELSGQV